jgi:acyl carrier protein
MDSKQIDELGRRVIAERLDVDISDVVDEASFIEDFDADAVNLIEIVLDIEDETGIKISDHEIDSIRAVGDFMNLVKRKNDERQSF